jgi:tRNA pseudouridine38-40 synthase
MARIKFTIAYDGAPFEGWQSQPGGNTVQDKLEAALSEIAGERVKLHGSGRTDTGVHALGQVAHFDAPEANRMDAGAWQRAVNTKLPRSVRVMDAVEVEGEFHARFSAVGKTYRYQIDLAPVLLPHRMDRVWHHPRALDVDLLRAACALYVGEHDFAPFAANRNDGKEPNTVRTITRAYVEEGDVLSITFSGNGFLYKMVRLLVGGAVRVAEGREELDWIGELLESPGVAKCQYCAPGDGLTLVGVEYR